MEGISASELATLRRVANEHARVVADLQRSGYFEIVQRITAEAETMRPRIAEMVHMIAEAQQRDVAAKLTPLIRKILADNDAALSHLSREMAPLIDQIVNQRLPAPSFEQVRSRMTPMPIVTKPMRARRRRTRQTDPELVAARERIAELEGRLRSLMFPDVFGDDDYPPMEPEYFGRN